MTDLGLEFYGELERTWKELADAVQTLTQPAEEQPAQPSTEENQPQP
jgi:PadR family transcriptional regulator PadR